MRGTKSIVLTFLGSLLLLFVSPLIPENPLPLESVHAASGIRACVSANASSVKINSFAGIKNKDGSLLLSATFVQANTGAVPNNTPFKVDVFRSDNGDTAYKSDIAVTTNNDSTLPSVYQYSGSASFTEQATDIPKTISGIPTTSVGYVFKISDTTSSSASPNCTESYTFPVVGGVVGDGTGGNGGTTGGGAPAIPDTIGACSSGLHSNSGEITLSKVTVADAGSTQGVAGSVDLTLSDAKEKARKEGYLKVQVYRNDGTEWRRLKNLVPSLNTAGPGKYKISFSDKTGLSQGKYFNYMVGVTVVDGAHAAAQKPDNVTKSDWDKAMDAAGHVIGAGVSGGALAGAGTLGVGAIPGFLVGIWGGVADVQAQAAFDATYDVPVAAATADSVKGYQDKFGEYTCSDVAQVLYASVPGSESPCGKEGPSITDPPRALLIMFCGLTIFGRDLVDSFLVSSGLFLAHASGLPQGTFSAAQGSLQDYSGTVLKFLGTDGRIENTLITGSYGAVARLAYQRVLNLVNALVVILLIGIALANVLQFQVNTYSFKKMLPGLIVGLILANTGFFVIRAGLEVSSYLSYGIILKSDPSNQESIANCGAPKCDANVGSYIHAFQAAGVINPSDGGKLLGADGKPDLGLVLGQTVLNVLVLVAAVMVFILAFLFLLRAIIFFFAAPLSPIAFIGFGFDPLKKLTDKYVSTIVSWIFMPVVAFFWLWLGFTWFTVVGATADGGVATNTGVSLLSFIFGIAMIYLAMKTPFNMAGEAKDLVKGWNNFGRDILGAPLTPYGAALRTGKAAKDWVAGFPKATDGPIFRNNIARKAGGDVVNRFNYRHQAKLKQMKDDVSAKENYLKGEALNRLTERPFLGKGINALGKKLEEVTKDNDSFLGKAVNGWGKTLQVTKYVRGENAIKDNEELGKLAQNKGKQNIQEAYFNEPLGVKRAQRMIQAEASEKNAEKAKSKAELSAIHASGHEIANDLEKQVPVLNAAVADKDRTLKSIMGLKEKDYRGKGITDDEWKKIEAFQNKHKDVYKVVTGRMSKHIDSEVGDAIKKAGDEGIGAIQLRAGSDELKNVALVMKGVGKDGKGNPELKPDDHSDAIVSMVALSREAASANDKTKVKRAVGALDSLKLAYAEAGNTARASEMDELKDRINLYADGGIDEAKFDSTRNDLINKINSATVLSAADKAVVAEIAALDKDTSSNASKARRKTVSKVKSKIERAVAANPDTPEAKALVESMKDFRKWTDTDNDALKTVSAEIRDESEFYKEIDSHRKNFDAGIKSAKR